MYVDKSTLKWIKEAYLQLNNSFTTLILNIPASLDGGTATEWNERPPWLE